MNEQEIRARVEALREFTDMDPETFHSRRDQLYLDVLTWISEHGDWPDAEFAEAALQAEAITPTWSACA